MAVGLGAWSASLSQVTYSYDDANRLTQITQGTSTVGFIYDTVNRRSTLTLSNGVNMATAFIAKQTEAIAQKGPLYLGNIAQDAGEQSGHNFLQDVI